MEIKKLQQRQLFCTKRETVEKKVVQYFEKTQDADSVVEYAIALMCVTHLFWEIFHCCFRM